MKKIIPFLLLASLISACGSGGTSTVLSDSISTDSLKSEPEDESPKWSYTDEEDKMTSKKTFYASVDAKEELEFKFPYNGGSVATLNVRKNKTGTDVYLTVTKGQFHNSVDGGSILSRFDKTPAKQTSILSASDGSADVVFIENAAGFLKKIKKHKKLFIEAEFFSEGNKQMEFDIENLKWDH